MPRIRENKCPCCGYLSDAATAPSDESILPKDGDLSVCINCGEFLQYGFDLSLHKMPESVLDNIDQESFDEMLKIRNTIISIKNNKYLKIGEP